jgi:UDP-N-acetylmuramoylalanine--D-glutamate ligase
MHDWKGKKIVILGAARQGTALARYLVRQGAFVILSDQKSKQELVGAQTALEDLSEVGHPIEWVFNEHPISLLEGCDVLCLSGGIPLTLPVVSEALVRNISVLNDSQIFLEVAPCPVIGITGSAGKTTTTLLVGKILEKAATSPGNRLYGKQVWVGGNIGNPLIINVENMRSDDIAVMELSSFQLEIMTNSPNIAAVLNFSPDHLDRHKSMTEYIAAKTRILTFQSSSDVAVLSRDDENTWSLSESTAARVISFGISELEEGMEGTFIRDSNVCIRYIEGKNSITSGGSFETGNPQAEESLLKVDDIPLRGEHNLRNVLAAAAITYAAGVSAECIEAGVIDFVGGQHRLEYIRTWNGAQWFNDSIATTPRRAIAAINSFDEPLVLLAGGRDKNLPWEELLDLIRRKVKTVILFGEIADKIFTALDLPENDVKEVIRCESLHDAVKIAADIVQSGDVVLLSPGGTSFDEFKNYEERGKCFAKWVQELP